MTTQTVLITGGTSGIGLATAQLLAERGAQVAVTGSSDRSVDAARAQLPESALVVRADSRDLDALDSLTAQIGERFGGLTGVFLNAGVVRRVPVAEADPSTFDELFAVNTRGAYFTLQRTLPLLADGGSVVVTVGAGGRSPGDAITAGSRGALRAMVPSLAMELAPRRIRVNTVSPGAIRTPIWDGLPPEAVDGIAASIPFGRLGEAREVAATVAFLMSDDAAYITGTDVVVGGGVGIG